MKRFSRLSAVGAMTLLLAFCVATVRAQVLDQIPSDALVVFKIKNLTEVNEKAAVLAKQFGLVEMTPAAADPLAALLAAAGMTNGVDKAGDAAMVLANGNLDGDQPPMLILVPVTDYKAFLGNFGETKKDGELDVFRMTFDGQQEKEDTYAANWGKYAVLTPMKDLLAKKPDGFKASGATAKQLATRDLVVVANIKVLGAMATKQIREHKAELMGEMEKAAGQEEKLAKYMPLLKVVVNQGLLIADEFLADTKAASFGINLSKEGISTSFMIDFEAGSKLGAALSETKGTTDSLLAGLPEAKYLLFGGGIRGNDAGLKLAEEWLAPIEAEVAKSGDELKPVLKLIEVMKKLSSAVKGQTMGAIAPTGAFMATPLLQTVAVMTGDVKVIQEAQLEALQAQQEVMALMPHQAVTKTNVTPNAKTIDGVSFTQFSTEITGTDAASVQAKTMFTVLFGPGGNAGFCGAVDDQHLLVVSGLDDATIGAAIKAVKDKADPLTKSAAVALANKNLPEKRVAAFYMDLGLIVTTATNYAAGMGMPIPVKIKPDLAPIGVAIATDGPAVMIDSIIPADLVESLVTTALQLKMMGAGGGPGKPGGL